MSDTSHSVNRFLDLEARVDDTSDEEEDREEHSMSFSILICGMVSYTLRIISQGFH